MKSDELIIGVILLLPAIGYYLFPIIGVKSFDGINMRTPAEAVDVCDDTRARFWMTPSDSNFICGQLPNIRVIVLILSILGVILIFTNLEK
jgi:hypothetical protein